MIGMISNKAKYAFRALLAIAAEPKLLLADEPTGELDRRALRSQVFADEA